MHFFIQVCMNTLMYVYMCAAKILVVLPFFETRSRIDLELTTSVKLLAISHSNYVCLCLLSAGNTRKCHHTWLFHIGSGHVTEILKYFTYGSPPWHPNISLIYLINTTDWTSKALSIPEFASLPFSFPLSLSFPFSPYTSFQFPRHSFTTYLRLAWNSLCGPGCSPFNLGSSPISGSLPYMSTTIPSSF